MDVETIKNKQERAIAEGSSNMVNKLIKKMLLTMENTSYTPSIS